MMLVSMIFLMNFIEDNFFDKDNFFVIISKTFS